MPGKEKAPSQCDSEAIGHALHTDACATADLAFGPGQRYDLAAGQTILEVFSERQLSRVTTPTSRLELFGTPPPQVVNGHVIFGRENGQDSVSLSVSPEGTVVFGYIHCPATPEKTTTTPETAQEPPPAARTGDQPLAADTTPRTTPRAPTSTGRSPEPAAPGLSPEATSSSPDTPPPANGGPTADTSKREQQPRLQLTGRLGRDPSFRTSPRGTLIGRFPLAVHQADGTTTWHSVLAFGDRARQLQHRADAGQLAKGQEISLIGYQHTRQQPTGDGHTKTVTEIYAVAVTRR